MFGTVDSRSLICVTCVISLGAVDTTEPFRAVEEELWVSELVEKVGLISGGPNGLPKSRLTPVIGPSAILLGLLSIMISVTASDGATDVT